MSRSVVTGDYKLGAIIVVNNVRLPTTVGKNDRLEATIPGSFRSQPTRLVVRIGTRWNSVPGHYYPGDSNDRPIHLYASAFSDSCGRTQTLN